MVAKILFHRVESRSPFPLQIKNFVHFFSDPSKSSFLRVTSMRCEKSRKDSLVPVIRLYSKIMYAISRPRRNRPTFWPFRSSKKTLLLEVRDRQDHLQSRFVLGVQHHEIGILIPGNGLIRFPTINSLRCFNFSNRGHRIKE